MRTESENFLNNADFVEKNENFLNNADFVEKNDMQIGIY